VPPSNGLVAFEPVGEPLYDARVSIPVSPATVLVLADGKTQSERNDARGHLFESFVARLLAKWGYSEPRTENLNVSANGIELDVVATHVTGQAAVAECKAYSTNVPAEMLGTFYGKLSMMRLSEADTFGWFVAIPSLTGPGVAQAKAIAARDRKFKLITAFDVVKFLEQANEVGDFPGGETLLSDRAVVITTHGTYSAAKQLDAETRLPTVVQVWGTELVPAPVIRLVEESDYAGGLTAVTPRAHSLTVRSVAPSVPIEPTVVEVTGSTHDFEYQLPAAPKFFVGRKDLLERFDELLADTEPRARVVVLNAQSGRGKSSLALRLRETVSRSGGRALVVDARTASSPEYVWAVMRRGLVAAVDHGLAQMPEDASFGSLASSLATARRSSWSDPTKALLIFFDQFESVFRDVRLTQEFRDLALGVTDLEVPLVIGFAWKTDIIGWTEDHPYQLRDEIRSRANVIHVEPLGPTDIQTLLGRLQKELGQRLSPELRQRLREYSQGLPWLFKKLASHILSEAHRGVTQEELVAEALNVQRLFDADLAELTPEEHEALRLIARSAPVPISEVLELVSAAVVNSLVHQRLIVQVGERIDTYWDIFRDFLNTGRVPIQETYILRYTPPPVGRLLKAVVEAGGDLTVADAAERVGTTERVVFNLARELRQMGVLVASPGRVRVASEIAEAEEIELAVRERITFALRRHRAYSILADMLEAGNGQVGIARYAETLPAAFPAVPASPKTWGVYARAFVRWFEYARLVSVVRDTVRSDPARSTALDLLGSGWVSRAPKLFPGGPPGPALELLDYMRGRRPNITVKRSVAAKAIRDLRALGLIHITEDGFLGFPDDVGSADDVSPAALREYLSRVPGGAEAIRSTEANPSITNDALGKILREASGAAWKDSTTRWVGRLFRQWTRAAEVQPRVSPSQEMLFNPAEQQTR
jgi:hypothetical protein